MNNRRKYLKIKSILPTNGPWFCPRGKSISVRESSITPSTKQWSLLHLPFSLSFYFSRLKVQSPGDPPRGKCVPRNSHIIISIVRLDRHRAAFFPVRHNAGHRITRPLTWRNVNLNPFYLSPWIINGGSHCPRGETDPFWTEKKEGYMTLQRLWHRRRSLAEKQLFHMSPIQKERVFCHF